MGLLDYLFGTDVKHQQKIYDHGHRCYTEGLNAYERSLVLRMATHLNSNKYFIFNNITIPSSYTITSQIDHVVVSEYGIFVIESKDYSGWVFGNKDQKEWVSMYRRGKKFKFQNPILQNFSHISALKEQLPFLQKSFFNVVVFSQSCEFKTERIPNVLYDSELIDFLKVKKRNG